MRPERKESSPVDPTRQYLAPLQDYAETAPDSSSFSVSDALFLGYFLERLARKVVVLEIGVTSGASTLWFAKHVQVSRVESIGPNSSAEVQDIARAVIRGYPAELEKVHFHESLPENLAETLREMDLPETGDGLVVFIGGQRTRESIAESLSAVLDFNPSATVLLGNCRHEWGPFVQAGVVDFLERRGDQYRFQLAADLGPTLSGSDIGVLYPVASAAGMEKTLDEVARTFSRKLDLLRLLSREEELMNIVSKLNRQLAQAGERNVRLQRQISRQKNSPPELETRLGAELERQRARNDALIAHYSSRRYKVVDALLDRLRRLPGATKLLRRIIRPGG